MIMQHIVFIYMIRVHSLANRSTLLNAYIIYVIMLILKHQFYPHTHHRTEKINVFFLAGNHKINNPMNEVKKITDSLLTPSLDIKPMLLPLS